MTKLLGIISTCRAKLILLVVLSLGPAILVAALTHLSLRRLEKERLTENISALARVIAVAEQNYLTHGHQLLTTLDGFKGLVRGNDSAFSSRHFQNLVKLSPDYLTFGLIESNGTVFASAVMPEEDPIFLGDRSYFTRTIASRRFSVGDFQVGRLTGERSINFGYPIFDEQGEVTRVLFAALKLERLTEAIQNAQLPPQTIVTILDRKGTVVARFPDADQWVGRKTIDRDFSKTVLRVQNGTTEMQGLDGIHRVYAISSVSDGTAPCFFVSVGVSTALLFADANRQLLAGFSLLVVVISLALVGSFFLAERGLLRPARSLVESANELASGNFSARASLPSNNAEFAEIARAFNAMAESLSNRNQQVKEAQEQISAMNLALEETVRKRTEELTIAHRDIEAFSYSVSHDLRAPLRHIVGFLALLEKRVSGQIDERSRGFLTNASDSARQMGVLIDDLLAFARTGRTALSKTEVNLAALVEQSVATLSPQVAGRNINWKIGTLPNVTADPALLKQVLINLLSNAVKYTRHRDMAQIEVGCERLNGEFSFFVRDNGAGFDMAYAGKLFGVFQRLHRDDEFEGTGIGLANVKQIIQRHGGRVWAEGELDKGATFFFSLPAEASPATGGHPPRSGLPG